MERYDQKELDAVANVIKSGELSRFFANFSGGKEVQAFENEFAKYLNVKHAVSVSNGTVALEVALAALDLQPGDEIITTPLTFIATATAILRAGAKPVFVDVNPDTLNMDENYVDQFITDKTKAILSVSLLGKPANVKQLQEIADENKILLLEDAAQSLGAQHDGVKVGTAGTWGTFSFQESKTITTLGEGGMIVTDDDEVYQKLLHIRNHGNTYGDGNMKVVCTNARLSEAAAAFGRVQLQKLEDFIKIQRENAQVLFDLLKYPMVPIYRSMDSTYYIIPYVVDGYMKRAGFIEKCKEAGIHLGLPGSNVGYYKKLVYDNPVFAPYKRKCPNAEWARDNVVLLDVHRWNKTPAQMVKYADIINRFFTS